MLEDKVKKIPPPILTLFLGIIMWGLNQQLPVLNAPFEHLKLVGAVISLLGIATLIISFRTFKRAGTTIDPVNPQRASELVTSGIFSYTRNPMYVGFTLILLGWGVWLGSLSPFACVLVFPFYISAFQITREEKVLIEKFGTNYLDYQNRVKRWI